MTEPETSEALLTVRNLSVVYGGSGRRQGSRVVALDDVSFSISTGSTLGVIGESGSGKSTAAKAVMQLEPAQSGEVLLRGRNLVGLGGKELRVTRREMQMVFQDPFGSFNPKALLRESLEEPLAVHHVGDPASRQKKINELVDAVGLQRAVLDRYPTNLSGGQLQRLNIARALAVDPALVVADEPTSALDVSIQAQIVNLLLSVQQQFKVTYLFISHDLPLVNLIADEVLVLFRGHVVESGSTADVFDNAAHPYTRELVSAVPAGTAEAEAERRRRRSTAPAVELTEDDSLREDEHLAAEADVRSGSHNACPYTSRCSLRQRICFQVRPPLAAVTVTHRSACHFFDQLAKLPPRDETFVKHSAEGSRR